MAYEDVPLTQGSVIAVNRESMRLRLERFPWWFLVILLVTAATALIITTKSTYTEAFGFIRAGLSVTIMTTISAYCIALILGMTTGLGRISRNVAFKNLATFYVEVIRGIPMLVLIFFIFFSFSHYF